MSTSALDGDIRDGRHLQSVRVYYEDTDFSGIVYHASYLRFMERGRTNYLRLLGADQRALFEEVEKEAPGFAFVVRSMTIDFRKPARMDDVLEIATAAAGGEGRIGRAASARGPGRRDPGRGDGAGRLRVRRPGPADPQGAPRCDEGRFQARRQAVDRSILSTTPAPSCKYLSHELETRQRASGYHHGNLKEALVRAALELIAEKGPAGFTFADAARWAGVSPAAPYRHFRDRDELMSDVARRGFDLFAEALKRAWGEGRPDPATAFDRLGKAYLEFARNEPAYYAAMFEAGISLDTNPEFREAGDRAFNVLRSATESLVATMPAKLRPPVMMMALHVWALSHGIASLFGRGDAASRKLPMAPEELLEAGVLLYLRGLGLPASPKP